MAMISQVVYDMVAFTIITIGIIVVFSLVAANINKFNPEVSIDSLKAFGLVMTHYYNVASGDWEESIEDLNLSQVINFYISGIALSILMINLLISVISLTFDKFLETKEFCDLEQLHDVMMDHSTFIHVLKRVGSKLFEVKIKDEDKFHHCFMIREEETEDNSTREDVQNLKLVVEMLRERMEINFRKVLSVVQTSGGSKNQKDGDTESDDNTQSVTKSLH